MTVVLAPALKLLWILIPLAVLAGAVSSPWFKGMAGEFVVNLAARLRLPKDKYTLIKSVTLPTADGTTQIDHVIVADTGVFVVETKNMKGWIFGSEKQRQWTQKIYRQTNKFQNPLHQNYKHVKALQSLLDLSDEQIHSVVVFVGDSKFKTDMPGNVTYGAGYIRYIRRFTEAVLPPDKVKEIIETIERGRLQPSFKTHREHIGHVKSIVEEKRAATSCPKCGSAMVARKVKRGANAGNRFLGCSNFPRCRGALELP